MRVKGIEGADWGIMTVEPGWHLVEVDKAEDFTNKNNKRSFSINFKIVDDDIPGGFITMYCPWGTEFGEKKIAAVLASCGLEDAFEKAFPGDVSYFDPKVVKKLSEKLVGYRCKVFVSERSNGMLDVTKVVNQKRDVSKLDETQDKGAKRSRTQSAPETSGNDGWD